MTAEEMREMCAAEMDRLNMPTCARIIRHLAVGPSANPECLHSLKLTDGPDRGECVKCGKWFKRELRWEFAPNPLTNRMSGLEAASIDAVWIQK